MSVILDGVLDQEMDEELVYSKYVLWIETFEDREVHS